MALPRALSGARFIIIIDTVIITKNSLVAVTRSFKPRGQYQQYNNSSILNENAKSERKTMKNAVIITYHRGYFEITATLPTGKDRCKFALKPAGTTLENFLEMLKKEDPEIRKIMFKSDGVRIASSTNIETLIHEKKLIMVMNESDEQTFEVVLSKVSTDIPDIYLKINEIKILVEHLYRDLNVEEFLQRREEELVQDLKKLQTELHLLQMMKISAEIKAQKRTQWLIWAGLGLMSMQFGVVARLTWWENSWENMEPITYFVTYANTMAAFAYFVLARREYRLNDVKRRQHLVFFYQEARKKQLDIDRYNFINNKMIEIEQILRKIRDPIRLRISRKSKK